MLYSCWLYGEDQGPLLTPIAKSHCDVKPRPTEAASAIRRQSEGERCCKRRARFRAVPGTRMNTDKKNSNCPRSSVQLLLDVCSVPSASLKLASEQSEQRSSIPDFDTAQPAKTGISKELCRFSLRDGMESFSFFFSRSAFHKLRLPRDRSAQKIGFVVACVARLQQVGLNMSAPLKNTVMYICHAATQRLSGHVGLGLQKARTCRSTTAKAFGVSPSHKHAAGLGKPSSICACCPDACELRFGDDGVLCYDAGCAAESS